MKIYLQKFFLIILLSLFIACNIDSKTHSIILYAPNLPDTTQVYIAGDIAQLGNWNPSLVTMQSLGNHKWVKKIAPQSGASIEYKFTLGSWQKEGLDKDGNAFSNFSINTIKVKKKTDTIYKWAKRSKKIVGQITGQVKYHKQMQGDGILDRDIIVWLPPNYESDIDKNYGVIYMHDGQNIFDPATSSFGIDWQIDETCYKRIKTNKMNPIIVVGIYNTADRNADYSPGKKGVAYMNFIIEKLKPFIDKTYRTLPSRENTVIGGSSMGGLISMMLVWEHSDVFSKAICMSPAFKIGRFDYVKTIRAYKGSKKDIKIYIDNGGIGLETQLESGINSMTKALKEKNYLEYKDYIYIKENDAKHNEAAWASRFPMALNFIYN